MVDTEPSPPDISSSLRRRHQSQGPSSNGRNYQPLIAHRKDTRKFSVKLSSISIFGFALLFFLALFAPANASVLPAPAPKDASIHSNDFAAASALNTSRSTSDAATFMTTGNARDQIINAISAASATRRDPSRTLIRRAESSPANTCSCGEESLSPGAKAGYAIVVPILVILSGIFAGLTLGYMSLDETQLQVLASTGTEKQREYARKIIPIRKDGHLLLTTLLIANMITNETLPIVSDPLFPSPVLAVVVSTVLVIIFAELVPQSVCSRYGLEIGAYMAIPTRIVIIGLWPIAFPVSRVLHWTLGPHHGIVYRRAELKELVTMHAASGGRGGDLVGDTVMMVGGALDLQEKVVEQAMTPIDKVFMLPFDAKLDYPTLQRIVRSGHSRIPIYHEVEVEVNQNASGATTPSKRGKNFFSALARRNTGSLSSSNEKFNPAHPGHSSPNALSLTSTPTTIKRKNIIGTLLVKSCVLLDPEDAVPVSDMTINALPTVPLDEPLHNVLNAFQEGRSHMAIVTSLSRNESNVALDPSSTSTLLVKKNNRLASGGAGGLKDIDEEAHLETGTTRTRRAGSSSSTTAGSDASSGGEGNKLRSFWKKHFSSEVSNEQVVPADAELGSSDEKTFVPADSAVAAKKLPPGPRHPRGDILGIITLEDVLEELIGEEIYDEYDPHEGDDGENGWGNISPPPSPGDAFAKHTEGGTDPKLNAAKDMELTLPPAAVAAAEEKQDKAESQATTQQEKQTQPPKTLLNRLGLTGRPKGSAGSGSSGAGPGTATATGTAGNSSPVPAAPTAAPVVIEPSTDAPTTSPVPMSPAEGDERDVPAATTAATRSGSGSDYFGQSNNTEEGSAPQQRSNSLGPTPARSGTGTITPGGLVFMPPSSASRPTTPGIQAGSNAPLATPQPNRPIVLRKTVPGGGTQNVIVGENMLRGRPANAAAALMAQQGGGAQAAGATGQATTGVTDPAAAGAGGSASRSSTPKPSRFKSTPVQHGIVGSSGPPGTGSVTGAGTTGGAMAAAARARSRSKSLEPRAGSAPAPAVASSQQEGEQEEGDEQAVVKDEVEEKKAE
ncbi:DUF21-domain-containing protein [Jaminaea rosea]|uniref:DUF21-domain-containing protein n=1 Tax=Jaminaea rosea TaxID=1569628 RepID=A0A316UQ10_9BASI|nr:DUF21-domain-containing protein [Jaminaea rosea]PWN26878.1 DUF21-domain-containing protein [Jaminaea rosea]